MKNIKSFQEMINESFLDTNDKIILLIAKEDNRYCTKGTKIEVNNYAKSNNIEAKEYPFTEVGNKNVQWIPKDELLKYFEKA